MFSQPSFELNPIESLPRNISLVDGLSLQLRELRNDDRRRLEIFFSLCSAGAIYYRFLSPFHSFSDGLLNHLTSVDGSRHTALVLIQEEGDEEMIVAEGRYVAFEERPSVADIAFLVIDNLQRRGIATLLIRELKKIACSNGISHFSADILADNRPMLSLLRKVGNHRPGTVTSGVIHYEIPISCSNLHTLSDAA
jgi:RimJ/RimL family protein N-acetyltransferase